MHMLQHTRNNSPIFFRQFLLGFPAIVASFTREENWFKSAHVHEHVSQQRLSWDHFRRFDAVWLKKSAWFSVLQSPTLPAATDQLSVIGNRT